MTNTVTIHFIVLTILDAKLYNYMYIRPFYNNKKKSIKKIENSGTRSQFIF